MDNAEQDIIKRAIDLMGRDVSLTIYDSSAIGGVRVHLGTITGVDATTGAGQIIVANYRDASGHTTLVIPRVLISVAEIVEIRR